MNITDIRMKSPLVLTYANFVTPQFVANAVNIIGASPLMSREPAEFNELARIANTVIINTGTLKKSEINDIIELSQEAYQLGKPVVLDPVAVSMPFRSKAITQFLASGHVDVIRGNAAEIAWFADMHFASQGIDATGKGDVIEIAQRAARKTGAVIALSGACDVVSDGQYTEILDINVKQLSTIVGTGDALSSLIGAFIADDLKVSNVMHAMATFKLAGQKAAAKTNQPGSFTNQLLDELFVIDNIAIQNFIKERVLNHG
ncbi:hydroxyethylthiazole kinase [Leuconostoc koreense]|nr:hydroxyethylthiazole kinase [Leuconostoc mesenteroides]QGM25335.1 hydroxyethylthiazole kinase [Leuconostoc mesenteroides subsp. mesenteroides]